jgi:hypothetical protein
MRPREKKDLYIRRNEILERLKAELRPKNPINTPIRGVVFEELFDEVASAYTGVDGFRDISTEKELIASYDGYTEYESFDLEKQMIERGWSLFTGNMPNGGEGGSQLESLLYSARISVVKDDFIMIQPYDGDELSFEKLGPNDPTPALSAKAVEQIIKDIEAKYPDEEGRKQMWLELNEIIEKKDRQLALAL